MLVKVSRSLSNLKEQEQNSIPAIEIFGGIFALLLVLFLLINLLSTVAINERIDKVSEEGLYRINWQNGGAGFVVITFPDSIRIIETNENIPYADLCTPQSPFVRYIEKVYGQEKTQIIFALLDNSVPVMRRSRDCIQQQMTGEKVSIGWIIASNDLLKSMRLGDIPAYIINAVGDSSQE